MMKLLIWFFQTDLTDEAWSLFCDDGEGGAEEYVFKNDVNLRIVCDPVNYEEDTVDEEWAMIYEKPYGDSKAYLRTYTIYYNVSKIERFYLIAVDGFNAALPATVMHEKTVTLRDYKFAQAVNVTRTLNEYMTSSNLEVHDDF